ncbi:Slp/YeaY family lipoprotein, partial [Pseudoxanthomonas daejeonensis]
MSARIPSFRIALAAATLALLNACASAPQPLQGTFLGVTPEQAVVGQQIGASVRWGGRIVQTLPGPDSTCFQVVATPLNATGRPDSNLADSAQGRFVACRAGFYDPEVFAPGREVTFVGRVQDTDSVRIGEYDYRLPRIAADVVYLWPVINEIRVVSDPWGPWGPWGPW